MTIMIPNKATITVTNQLESMSSFAVRMDGVDGAVFIPAKIATALKLGIGDTVEALLVPNTTQADRTPWLAIRVEPVKAQTSDYPIIERVKDVMKEGGVWNQSRMFEELFPNGDRATNLDEYNAISAAFRSIFNSGGCSKFQLWRAAGQSKSSREWFTCFPDRADVDEWAEQE